VGHTARCEIRHVIKKGARGMWMACVPRLRSAGL
jgi:hypothetical protein